MLTWKQSEGGGCGTFSGLWRNSPRETLHPSHRGPRAYVCHLARHGGWRH